MVKRSALTFIYSVLVATPSFAENVVSQYQNEKTKFLQKEVNQRNVLSDLYNIKIQMKRINKDKTKLQTKYAKVQTKYDILNQTVENLESRIDKQKIEIRRRLSFMIKFQDLSFLKLLFSSQTPVELDRNLKLLKLLTEKDFVSLKSYFKDINTLIVKRDQLKKEKETLAQLRNSVLEIERELATNKDKKTFLLGEISTQKALSLLKLKKLRLQTMPNSVAKSKAEAFYDTILKPLVFEEKGDLSPPVVGKIVQKYGFYHDPIYETKLRHKGIFIQATLDSDVYTIYDGEVSFSGTIPGFGKTVIISHGDHYYSVYSHVDKITVKEGQTVTKNQAIAKSGNTHPFFGSGLYFEVRHFSEPTDPLEWINLTNTGEKHAAI